jgi:hypothetical protein
MNSTLQTRKPIDTLTAEDLNAFMVWEISEDESWVRPLGSSTIPRDTCSLSVVADFVTADGTPFLGIVALSTFDAIGFDGASLVAGGACIQAAQGEKTPLRYKTLTASQLGKPPAHIYPLRFTLRAKVEGEAAVRSGIFA